MILSPAQMIEVKKQRQDDLTDTIDALYAKIDGARELQERMKAAGVVYWSDELLEVLGEDA